MEKYKTVQLGDVFKKKKSAGSNTAKAGEESLRLTTII